MASAAASLNPAYFWLDYPQDKLCNESSAPKTHIKMSFLVRSFAAALVISALLTQASYAQENFPMSDRQKAEIARKQSEQKATDEAYKAAIKRAPDLKQKTDPWANLRPPSGNGDK